MKILHVVPTYFPYQSGGSAYSLFRLNNSLKDVKKIIISKGHKVDKNKRSVFIDKNHKVFFFRIASPFLYIRLLKECIKSDIIQLSSFFFPPNIFIFLIAKFFNKKLIISPRGEFYDYALSNKLKSKYLVIKLFNFLNLDPILHATCDKEIELIKEKIVVKNKSIYKIYNSFDTEFTFNEKRLNQFLFLGRINSIKNIHSVFNALKSTENILFLIAGEAVSESEIKYLNFLKKEINKLKIQDKVKFLGKVDGSEKYKLLATSKLLVLPSHSENFGNVVLESLSQGTPVLASKGTPWSSLEKNQCGFQIDFNSTDAILEKIRYFQELKKSNFVEIKKHSLDFLNVFKSNKIKNKWIELYSNHLKNK
jgi:glycosyltransferase involved in cell wall biosynthesis